MQISDADYCRREKAEFLQDRIINTCMAANGYTIRIGWNQRFSWVNINRANKTINSEVQMCHTEESELNI